MGTAWNGISYIIFKILSSDSLLYKMWVKWSRPYIT